MRRTISPMRTARIVSRVLAVVAFAASLAAQQQPVFRGGVDLMSVDVVVLDKAGMPVSSLTAEDFGVTFAKKPRRVVAAEYVSSTRPARAAALQSAPSASSNRRMIAPRTLMFLVDTTQIPSGTGRLAMKGIGDYLDRLGPDDRVGVMTLSDTRVAPTVERAPVRSAVEQLVGTSARLRDREMTFGEANGIMARDRMALLAYWSRVADQGSAMANDRICAPPPGYESTVNVSQVCVSQAEMVIERVRSESRRVINRLIAIADAMAVYPDQKAIVLLSGGLYSDDKLREDFANFAAVAEQTHVSMSSIFVEPEGSGGAGSSSGTRRYDSQVGFGGLVDLASISRGTAHRVVSESTSALARLDRELSGYYIVSFERDSVDAAGTRLELDVRTRRPDVSIVTRKALTPGRSVTRPGAEKAAADLKGGVAALLKSQIAVSQIPISVDSFAMPATATGSDARVILAVEIGRDPKAIAALGFQFADATGKVLGDGYDEPPKVEQLAPGRSGFVTAVPATSGRFFLRVGAIDAQGERGSLQHSFEISPWPQGAIRLSDLMFGSAASGDFAPGVGGSSDGNLAMRLIVRDNTSKFDGVKVKLVVAQASDARPVDDVEIPLRQTPDALRRFADASVKMSAYPPGEYVVSMIVTAQGAEVGRRQRAFVR
jgi:VWFA-related protein